MIYIYILLSSAGGDVSNLEITSCRMVQTDHVTWSCLIFSVCMPCEDSRSFDFWWGRVGLNFLHTFKILYFVFFFYFLTNNQIQINPRRNHIIWTWDQVCVCVYHRSMVSYKIGSGLIWQFFNHHFKSFWSIRY